MGVVLFDESAGWNALLSQILCFLVRFDDFAEFLVIFLDFCSDFLDFSQFCFIFRDFFLILLIFGHFLVKISNFQSNSQNFPIFSPDIGFFMYSLMMYFKDSL